MIISRTPFRISFFGGGTDYPAWYQERGGAVLSTTIDKYCYIFGRALPPFFGHHSRIVYSKIELVGSNTEIEHPAVRECLRYMQMEDGIEIHHDGDLPARTGIGSSSSFTVGLLNTLYALRGVMPTKLQLARDAIYVEQSLIGESVGCQDQAAAAFGGFNRMTFQRSGDIEVEPVILGSERLAEFWSHLVLVFTGFARTASDVAAKQVMATPSKVAELEAMQQLVDEALAVLCGTAELTEFGKLLHEGWLLKRSLTAEISTPTIDDLYEEARRGGALGGKLLGAGGGGFALFFVPPEARSSMLERLPGLMQVPFKPEPAGSQIIMYQPGGERDGAEPRDALPMTAGSGLSLKPMPLVGLSQS